MKSYKDIDEYISNFPEDIQKRLNVIRKAIKKEVPLAEEKISYGIATFALKGKNFIYFAGYKNHVSLYPVTPAIEKSVKNIENYRTGKGTLQFSNNTLLPIELISNVIKVRKKEHLDMLGSK